MATHCGNDLAAINAAIEEAKQETSKPTLIEVKTVIGFGAPKAGTNAVHGAPLGAEGVKETKAALNWDYPEFTVPDEVYARFKRDIAEAGAQQEAAWNEMFAKYAAEYPELAQAFKASFTNELPANLASAVPTYTTESIASRAASANAINAIAQEMDNLWGGAADLSSSNKTMISGSGDFQPDSYAGRNIWFGVREFGMACAMNGILLHGGTRVFGGTFFVFTDYLRAAIRLSALQHIPAIYVLTHDSVAVGEDGPTHEPIEQLASLRAMPNVQVLRPADGNETSAAWLTALETTDKPTVLVLSRQNLATLPQNFANALAGMRMGGYVVSPAQGTQEGILLATGSEVNLALAAQKELATQGHAVSVVSLPSFDRFKAQSAEYRNSVLPATITKRLSIEAGSTFGWGEFVGTAGKSLGIDKFGASAPGEKVLAEYGFTVENVVAAYLSMD